MSSSSSVDSSSQYDSSVYTHHQQQQQLQHMSEFGANSFRGVVVPNQYYIQQSCDFPSSAQQLSSKPDISTAGSTVLNSTATTTSPSISSPSPTNQSVNDGAACNTTLPSQSDGMSFVTHHSPQQETVPRSPFQHKYGASDALSDEAALEVKLEGPQGNSPMAHHIPPQCQNPTNQSSLVVLDDLSLGGKHPSSNFQQDLGRTDPSSEYAEHVLSQQHQKEPFIPHILQRNDMDEASYHITYSHNHELHDPYNSMVNRRGYDKLEEIPDSSQCQQECTPFNSNAPSEIRDGEQQHQQGQQCFLRGSQDIGTFSEQHALAALYGQQAANSLFFGGQNHQQFQRHTADRMTMSHASLSLADQNTQSGGLPVHNSGSSGGNGEGYKGTSNEILGSQRVMAFLAGPRERIHVYGNPIQFCPRCQQEGYDNIPWRPHKHIGELKIRYICDRNFEDLESNHHFDIPLCPLCSQVLYLYEFNGMLGVSSARRLHKYILKCASRHVLPLIDLFCQTKRGNGRCFSNFKLQWSYGTMVKRCEAQKNRDHDLWWVRYKNEWKQRRTIIRYKKDFLRHLSDVQRSLLLGLGVEGEAFLDPKIALGPTYDALLAAAVGSSYGPKIKKRHAERRSVAQSSHVSSLSSHDEYEYSADVQTPVKRQQRESISQPPYYYSQPHVSPMGAGSSPTEIHQMLSLADNHHLGQQMIPTSTYSDGGSTHEEAFQVESQLIQAPQDYYSSGILTSHAYTGMSCSATSDEVQSGEPSNPTGTPYNRTLRGQVGINGKSSDAPGDPSSMYNILTRSEGNGKKISMLIPPHHCDMLAAANINPNQKDAEDVERAGYGDDASHRGATSSPMWSNCQLIN